METRIFHQALARFGWTMFGVWVPRQPFSSVQHSTIGANTTATIMKTPVLFVRVSSITVQCVRSTNIVVEANDPCMHQTDMNAELQQSYTITVRDNRDSRAQLCGVRFIHRHSNSHQRNRTSMLKIELAGAQVLGVK